MPGGTVAFGLTGRNGTIPLNANLSGESTGTESGLLLQKRSRFIGKAIAAAKEPRSRGPVGRSSDTRTTHKHFAESMEGSEGFKAFEPCGEMQRDGCYSQQRFFAYTVLAPRSCRDHPAHPQTLLRR